jgi:hypothetical protein
LGDWRRSPVLNRLGFLRISQAWRPPRLLPPMNVGVCHGHPG